MKTLREPTKGDALLAIFDEVGKSMKVEDVLAITGISNYNSLKAHLSGIRKLKHIPEENRIDVRISGGLCVRVN